MTKDEAKHLLDCASALVVAIPKKKLFELVEQANDLMVYLEKLQRSAE